MRSCTPASLLVATVLTGYGIETNKDTYCPLANLSVATVLIVYGIETCII